MIDRQFNTIDVCLVLPTRAGAGPLPAPLPPAPHAHRGGRLSAMTKRPLRGALRGFSFLALTGILLLALSAGDGAGHARHAGGAPALVPWHRLDPGRADHACPAARSPTARPCYVANHVSYLDILVLGAVRRRHLHRQVRDRRLAAVRHAGPADPDPVRPPALAQRPDPAQRAGRPHAARARASSCSARAPARDGLGVLPIKTSLLSVAEPWILDCPIAVQPVTLVYARLADGTPIGARQLRPLCLVRGGGVPAASVGCAAAGRRRDPRRSLADPVLSWSVKSRKVLGRELRAQLGAELARARLAQARAERRNLQSTGTPPSSRE